MKNIIFIEKQSHIDKALSFINRLNLTEYLIISLFPGVAVGLEERKINFKTPEDFSSLDKLNKIGMDNYRLASDFCKYVDDFIKSRNDIFENENINAASMHYYHFKILLDSVISKYYFLEQIIETQKPENIYYMSSQKEKIGRELFFNKSSIYSRIIPIIAKKYNIKSVAYGEEAEFYPDKRRSYWKFLAELIRYSPATLIRISERFIDNLLHIRFNRKNKNVIFVLASGHDVPHIIEELKKTGSWAIYQLFYDAIKDPHPVFPYAKAKSFEPDKENLSVLRSTVEVLWGDMQNDKIFRAFFVFKGCDLFPVFEDRLSFFIRKGIVEIFEAYSKHQKAFEFYKPKLILTSTTNLGYIGQAIIYAAKSSGIPTITYQEGAGYGSPNAPMYDHTEYLTCDYFLSYGGGTEDHLKKTLAVYRSKIIPVGSIRLDKIMKKNKKKANSRIENIMYITSYVQNNIQHFPYNAGTANYNFRVQKRIFELLKNHRDYAIFIKFSEISYKEIAHYIKAIGLGNFKLIENIPLEYVLPYADMYILDFPSTVHLECIVTGKPVFIYLDKFMTEIDTESYELLTKRAFCYRDFDDFEKGLTNVLDSGYVNERNDDGYVKQFCTHLNDGKSLDRVKCFIEMLKSNEKKL